MWITEMKVVLLQSRLSNGWTNTPRNVPTALIGLRKMEDAIT